jgi:hypothetical protein
MRNLRQTQVLERVIRRSRICFQPPTDTGSSLYYISLKWPLSCVVLCCPVRYRRPNGLKIGTNTNWKYAMKIGGWRSRVRIDARAVRANVRAAPHIQHRPPDWVDMLGRSRPKLVQTLIGTMGRSYGGGGYRECALMHALCAETCAQHHLSSIGTRRTGPIEPKLAQKLIVEMCTSYGSRCARSTRRARAERNRSGAAVPRERENEREAREYSDGTRRRNRREREVRVWGACSVHIARSAEQQKKKKKSCVISDRHRC